jgi:acyl-coenzyme A synthetase/AMP-(fatty) acid ligase
MGTCVGAAFETMELKVIQISDQPLKSISDCQEVNRYEVGELMVKGVTVTDHYVTSTHANEYHKVRDGNSFWHRMGDVGYMDSQDRFWFCGRKSHRINTKTGTMFTVPCESIINTHPSVYRSALVGVGSGDEKTPVMIIEPEKGRWPAGAVEQATLTKELTELASRYWQTDTIKHFLFHKSLPVDIRHNSKIFREKLTPWAAKRVK